MRSSVMKHSPRGLKVKNGLNPCYLQSILNTLSSQNERYIRSRHFPAQTPQGKFILLTEKASLLTMALRFMCLLASISSLPSSPILLSLGFLLQPCRPLG